MTSNPCASRIPVPGTDISISRLGFGAARLFAGPERRASARLIETALQLGIRHFDTAPSYASGESESILGEVLAGQGDVTVTTKVGIACTPQGRRPLGTAYRLMLRPLLALAPGVKARLLQWRQQLRRPAPLQIPVPRRILSRDEIHATLEQSLHRLRRSRVDLYLIHEPDQFIINDDLVAIFEDLCRQGVIGAWGLGYGRPAMDAPNLGQILQCGPIPHDITGSRLLIMHGLLRRATMTNLSARDRIRDVQRSHQHAAILTSASTPRQLLDLCSHTDLQK